MMTIVILGSTPIAAAVLGWGLWRRVRIDGTPHAWRDAALGVGVGLLGWPAAIGLLWVVLVTVASVALDILSILVAVTTWAPGRG